MINDNLLLMMLFHGSFCFKFLLSQSGRCQCGHTREFHEEVGLITTVPSNSEEKWNPDIHTERISPNTYGTIAFHGFGQEIIRHAPVSPQHLLLFYLDKQASVMFTWQKNTVEHCMHTKFVP